LTAPSSAWCRRWRAASGFGVDLDAADANQRRGVERRWGILFQQGALFSSLTVRQNIQFPVREYLKPRKTARRGWSPSS
jgi:ABC-type transporter Mla maintaining outer membrane lipid asymmetry ATPase subunit MlaF